MPNYRRALHHGGTYFFTVNLLQRRDNDLLTRHIDLLRQVVSAVRQSHPFDIHAWVVLPDHLHCVLKMPEDNADFALRWRLIKAGFSRGLPKTEGRSIARVGRNELANCSA
jgi:putative transposase